MSSFNGNSNSPCNMANLSEMERRILIGSLNGPYFAILTADMHHSSISKIINKQFPRRDEISGFFSVFVF